MACAAQTLNKVSEMTLPSHESDKSLADQFASFFLNKIKTIRDTFVPSGTENDVHPPSYPPKLLPLHTFLNILLIK